MSEFEKGEAMGQMLMEVVPMLIPGGGGIAQVLSKFKTFQKVADKVKDVAQAVKKKASDLADSAMCIIKSGCFIAGTLVATPQGLIPIEDFEAGDIVYALDPESGEWGEQVVIEPLERVWCGDIITIDLFGEEIETTGNHPFWVLSGDDLAQRAAVEELSGHYERGIEGRWVEARHIRVGDMVLLRSGESVCVYALQSRIGAAWVYNLHVANWHTYAVGTRGVLVHNSSRGGAKPCEKGKAGVEKSRSAAEARGETIIGEEVILDIPGTNTYTKADLVTKDVNEHLTIIESKNGPHAKMTENQKFARNSLEGYGHLEPRGPNAEKAGILGIKFEGSYRVDHWNSGS